MTAEPLIFIFYNVIFQALVQSSEVISASAADLVVYVSQLASTVCTLRLFSFSWLYSNSLQNKRYEGVCFILLLLTISYP